MNPFGTICGVVILISKLLYVTVYFVMKHLIYTEKGYNLGNIHKEILRKRFRSPVLSLPFPN